LALTVSAQAANREITDESIRVALENALSRDPGVDAQLVDVQVKEGIVSLDGHVETIRSRDRAGELAEAMRGVRAVENGLEVRPTSRPDEEIRQDVLAAIQDDPVLDDKHIKVEVQEGRVRLTGEADSWGHRQLFSEALTGVRGARDIANSLEVRQSRARDEHEVAAEIQKRLMRNVWTQDANVRVEVRDGAAKLSGSVNSAAQKKLVERAAFVRGVRAVDTSGLAVRTMPPGKKEPAVRVAALRDSQLAEDVKAAFELDPRLVNTSIEVQADGGAITLVGEAASYFAKQAAELDALGTVGVLQVENRLRVRPASALPSDEELAARVERALNRDVDTSRMNIQLDVRNGKVRLGGFVEAAYERELAERVTSRVDGVIDLENAVKVSGGGPALADAELRAAIEEQLWWNPYVEVADMTFDVRDGGVTITGNIPNYMKRELVSDVAMAAGARQVTNHLQLPRR
jgi:osmotically-inducible protein OsmY